MATGGLNTFRDSAVYIGWAKQTQWGVGVPPTSFWLWRDGTDANPNAKIQVEREGDTSGAASLAYKTWQGGMLKIVEYARPIPLGCSLQSLLGAGSDVYSATVNTTLSAATVVGGTSIQVAANLGNVGTQGVALEGGYASTNYEAVMLDLTTKAGVGPFTYTLANSGTIKKVHLSGTSVTAASHALGVKYSYDPYSIEVGWNTDGGLLKVQRYIDCYCVSMALQSGKGGMPLRTEHTWYAGRTRHISSTTLATVTMPTGAAFKHSDAKGAWLLGGSASGNMATVEQMSLTIKRTTSPEEFQSEGITSDYAMPGNIDVSGSLATIFNSWADYNQMWYGGASPADNTDDSVLVAENSFGVTYTQDPVNSLALSIPYITYKATPLKMSLKGTGMRQPISFEARHNPGSAFLTATLTNSLMSAY